MARITVLHVLVEPLDLDQLLPSPSRMLTKGKDRLLTCAAQKHTCAFAGSYRAATVREPSPRRLFQHPAGSSEQNPQVSHKTKYQLLNRNSRPNRAGDTLNAQNHWKIGPGYTGWEQSADLTDTSDLPWRCPDK
jgi:hypothetical protein